ncbi:hypothetical protein IJ596_07495 [bacterium]|nr:hypothetical protein [bacterium]
MSDKQNERQHVFLDGYAPDNYLHQGKKYKYKSYARGCNLSVDTTNNTKNKLLSKIESHFKTYRNVREYIRDDVEEIFENNYCEIFKSKVFLNMMDSYKPFKDYIEYCIKKYDK